MSAIPENATHIVRGFAGQKHPTIAEGLLLVETWHRGESSKDMEVAAWMERRKNGEVSRIEVVDRRNYRLTVIAP